MIETIWLLLALWVVLLILGLTKKGIIMYIATLLGVFFGLDISNNVSLLYGVPIILLNLGLLYEQIFRSGKNA